MFPLGRANVCDRALVLAVAPRALYKRPPNPPPERIMAESRDTPATGRTPDPGAAPSSQGARKGEAARRSAEALRENLKRRKAQARARKAQAHAPADEDAGESAEGAQES
jgi:hypothetical protein